jgi:hypothetical protein
LVASGGGDQLTLDVERHGLAERRDQLALSSDIRKYRRGGQTAFPRMPKGVQYLVSVTASFEYGRFPGSYLIWDGSLSTSLHFRVQESGMGRCNAQTNAGSSVVARLIVERNTARLSGTCAITKKERPSQHTPRGLELVNSCAKFYANGAGVVKPRVQIAHLQSAVLDEPTRQTISLTPLKGEPQQRGRHVLVFVGSTQPGSCDFGVVGQCRPVRSRTGSRRHCCERSDSAIRKPRSHSAGHSTGARCSADSLERPVRYHHSQSQDAADNRRCQGRVGSRVDGEIVTRSAKIGETPGRD